MLRITGTTLTGNMRVRLDGQTAAAFNVISDATSKAFSFNVIYHPGDCIVALQKLKTLSGEMAEMQLFSERGKGNRPRMGVS